MALRALIRVRNDRVTAAWIRRGTEFLCIDALRANRSRDRGVEACAGPEVAIESDAERIDAGIDATRALAVLPAPCYDLLRARFWEDRTWAELDATLGGRRSQYALGKCLELLYATMMRGDW